MSALPGENDQLDSLDPLEEADREELMEEESNEEGANATPEEQAAPVDLPPEIEAEIKKVIVSDDELEPPVTSKGKSNSHMIPKDLIDQPLDPSTDLFDEGSI